MLTLFDRTARMRALPLYTLIDKGLDGIAPKRRKFRLGIERRLVPKVEKVFGPVAMHVHTRDEKNERGFEDARYSHGTIIKWLKRKHYGDTKPLVVFTEHTSDPADPLSLTMSSPLITRLLKEHAIVKHAGAKAGVQVLYGCEVNILPGGAIDVPDAFMDEMDFVLAARHGGFGLDEKNPKVVASNLSKAMAHPQVDAIAHPGRFLEETDIDWMPIFDEARRTGTLVEINLNTFPPRMSQHTGSSFDTRVAWWKEWLRLLAESRAPITMGLDFHNFYPYREGSELHKPSYPPGRLAWLRVSDLIDTMLEAGIDPRQIVSANPELLAAWIATDKAQRMQLLEL